MKWTVHPHYVVPEIPPPPRRAKKKMKPISSTGLATGHPVNKKNISIAMLHLLK